MAQPSKWIIVAITSSGIALLCLFLGQFHVFADQAQVKQTASTRVTIRVQAQPVSRQDFRFHSDLGDFRLDQPALDDGDAITQSVTFTVTPGVYQVTEVVPATWQLSQISCDPAPQVAIQLPLGQATLTVNAGDQLHCTFVNQRGVVIRTRSYHDADGSRTYSLGEQYLSDRKLTLYKDQNILISTQLTNQYGKANFNYLQSGDYAICETIQQQWANSQPGSTDPVYGSTCYSFTLQPGALTTAWFGNQAVGDPLPETPPAPAAVTIGQSADVEQDDSGYDAWVFSDADLNKDERAPIVFLPIVFVH